METPPQNPGAGNIEAAESLERGANVFVRIDLIRHPEKDPATGKLTEEGKRVFTENLTKEFDEGESFDTVKFYVSPLPRGQESKAPISTFLEARNVPTAIRTREGLLGKAREITPALKEEMAKILEQVESLPQEQIDEARVKDAELAAYEPANKDMETRTNEILIRDFFDKEYPGSIFTGEEMGQGVKDLIDHISKMATRLKANSKVRLVLVGHSGIIEQFTKYVYLQNHPELKSEDVGVEDIGGLLNFGEGPEIVIRSDKVGKQTIELRFKDLVLNYNHG